LDRTIDFDLHCVVAPSTSPERPSSKRCARSSSPYFNSDIDAPSSTEEGTPPISPPPYAPPSGKAIRDALATIHPILHKILSDLVGPLVDAGVAARIDAEVAARIDAEVAARIDAEVATRIDAEVAARIDAQVAARINAQQSEIDDGMLEHAAQIHNELDETLGDHWLNMNEAKEVGIEEMNTALNAVIDEGLQDFKVSTQGIVEGLDEHVKDVFTKTCEGLDGLLGEQLASLQREMKILEQKRKEFEVKQQQHLEQKNRTGESKRATSLPL
jgi:hypothetical protein